MNEPEEHSVSIGELAGYRLWNLVQKARFYDRESLGVELGAEEEESAWAAFCERHKVNAASALPVPEEYAGCSPAQLREVAARELRIARWKEREFGPQVEGVARELWLRIHEGEATFSGLAALHGGGMEKLTGGIIGPVPLGTMHTVLADHLMSAREGELLKPVKIGEWHLVARLEKRIPAVLDAQIRAAILDELATKRMEEHVQRG